MKTDSVKFCLQRLLTRLALVHRGFTNIFACFRGLLHEFLTCNSKPNMECLLGATSYLAKSWGLLPESTVHSCTKLFAHASQASTGATQAQQVSVKGQPYWKRRESTYSRASILSCAHQAASMQEAEPLKQVTFKRSAGPDPRSCIVLRTYSRSSLAFHRPGVLQVWEKNLCNRMAVKPSIPAPQPFMESRKRRMDETGQ